MTEPVYTLGVELSVGSFTNLTSYCERAAFGRSLWTLFSPPVVDSAHFQIANDLGNYSPLRQSGLQPGRLISFSAVHSTETFPLFYGRIKQILTKPGLTDRTTVIEAVTEIDRLGRTRLRTGMFTNIQINSLFTEVMTRVGVASFTAGNGLSKKVQFAWYQEHTAVNALQELIDSGLHEAFVDGAGTFRLRERYGFNSSGFVVNTLVNDAFMDLNYTLSDATIMNRLRVTAQPRYQSSNVATLAFLSQPVPIPSSGSIGFFAAFRDPSNFGVIGAPVGSIVALVASQDYYASANSDGTGTNYTASLSLSMTTYAGTAVCSLYSAVSSTAYLSRFQIRGYPILTGVDFSIVTDDASSQSLYGVVERALADVLVTDRDYLSAYGVSLVADQAAPRDALSLVLKNEFPQMLKLDMGHFLSIVNSPTGINSAWAIRSAAHEIELSAGLSHTATYDLELQNITPTIIVDSATFDGTNDYMLRGGDLTGAADGSKGLVSFWYKSSANGQQDILCSTGLTVEIFIDTGNTAQIKIEATGGAIVLILATESESFPATWHHLIASWDMADRSRMWLYIDDLPDFTVRRAVLGSTLDYTSTNWEVGVSPTNTDKLNGDLAELYFNPTVYLDLSVIKNRRKFITSDLKPVDLGVSGELPTGTPPIIYLHLDDGEAVANFATNRGSGGDFTITGALTTSATSPSD